jgi:hypothetical protein
MADKTYLAEILRDDLQSFQGRVEDEEVGASEFTGNEVRTEGNQALNLATFRVLPPGRIPRTPKFVELGALPVGQVPLWTGIVALGAKTVAVSMYRA